MSPARGLPWTIVVCWSLALATPGVGQEAPRGLDEALSGQVPKPVEPKRETPPVVLGPVFWSPSPAASVFIKELRQTKTADLPSADTLCRDPDPDALTFESKCPPLNPKRLVVYVALADPVLGMSVDRRCEQIREELEAERLRIEGNGTLRGNDAVAAACVNVWAKHESARLARKLDPKGEIYQQRLFWMRARKGPGETDAQIAERLNDQIWAQHIDQLFGGDATAAERYRQRLPQMLAEKGPEETDQEVEERLREQFQGFHDPVRLGIGEKKIAVERAALELWPYRAASDRNARFEKECQNLLYHRRIWALARREHLIHYLRARTPQVNYEELQRVAGNRRLPKIYQDALELVQRELKADLLMRLSEMNAWETADRGTPEAYRQVEALMNRALDAALAANPRAEERRQFYQTQLRLPRDRAEQAVRAEFRTEFLLRLCDSPRDARSPEERTLDRVLKEEAEARKRLEFLLTQPGFSPQRARERLKAEFRSAIAWRLDRAKQGGANLDERDIPEAPLHPEFRVKQFVREDRLASVTAAADRLHGVLSPRAGQPPPAGEQIRDALCEACANRTREAMQELRAVYRDRWLVSPLTKPAMNSDSIFAAT